MEDFVKMPPVGFTVTRNMVQRFAGLTGDRSSLHLDPEFGRRTVFGANIVHGMLSFSFISALPLLRNGFLRRMNARFARPVFAGDSILLEALSTESASSTLAEFTLQKNDGTLVANGSVEVARSRGAESNSEQERLTPTNSIPLATLEERDLESAEIRKGDDFAFTFAVGSHHLADLEEILDEGLLAATRPVIAGGIENATNLLGAFMISPFIGMCIPGRLGLLTHFEITCNQPLEQNMPYEFRGSVLFKSMSASTVVESFVVTEANTGREAAFGKITSKINAIQDAAVSMSTATEITPQL